MFQDYEVAYSEEGDAHKEAQLKDYLMSLTEKGLLGYDVYTRKFKTTEKGPRFLTPMIR